MVLDLLAQKEVEVRCFVVKVFICKHRTVRVFTISRCVTLTLFVLLQSGSFAGNGMGGGGGGGEYGGRQNFEVR